MLLFLGRLADLFGRKLTFIAGCVAMGVFGLGCGFAQGMSHFLINFLILSGRVSLLLHSE